MAAVEVAVGDRCEQVSVYERDYEFIDPDIQEGAELVCGPLRLRHVEGHEYPENALVSYEAHTSADSVLNLGPPFGQLYIRGDTEIWGNGLSKREWRTVLSHLPENEETE